MSNVSEHVELTTGSRAYYVYALLDPRTDPAEPFYIGKGIGARMQHHGLEDGESPKLKVIREIHAAGIEYQAMKLVTDLTEEQALRIEMQLIAAYGLRANGGSLVNVVQPVNPSARPSKAVRCHAGGPERAQMALNLLKDEVAALAQMNPQGITNANVAHTLGLHSSHAGGQTNHLSYSILGLLLLEGRLIKGRLRNEVRYWNPKHFAAQSQLGDRIEA